MYHLVQEVVSERINSIISFVIGAVLLSIVFTKAFKVVEQWYAGNNLQHRQSMTLVTNTLRQIDTLKSDVEDMETQLEDIEDDVTELFKKSTPETERERTDGDNFSDV